MGSNVQWALSGTIGAIALLVSLFFVNLARTGFKTGVGRSGCKPSE